MVTDLRDALRAWRLAASMLGFNRARDMMQNNERPSARTAEWEIELRRLDEIVYRELEKLESKRED